MNSVGVVDLGKNGVVQSCGSVYNKNNTECTYAFLKE